MHKISQRVVMSWVMSALLFSSSAFAAGGKQINVQGKLADSAGNPLTGSNIVVTFRLYSNLGDPVANAVWAESQGVTPQNGLFNVTLGKVSSMDSVPFNTPYYLGMQVAGDPDELAPRQLLGSSAYSMGSLGDFNVQGNEAVNGNISTNGNVSASSVSERGQDVVSYLVPVGTILPFAGAMAPSGYFVCDGSSISRAAYPALFAVLGVSWGSVDGASFNLPDLKGRTPIGAGQGSGLTNRTIGQTTGEEYHLLSLSEIPSHSHGVTDPGHTHALDRGSGTGYAGSLSGNYTYAAGNDTTSYTFNTSVRKNPTGISIQSTGGGGAHNNMQPSAVVSFIIKS
jgi:microcystin-dependent protein